MASVFLNSAAAILILIWGTWLVSVCLRNVSIVDIVWGLGFIVVAWVSLLTSHPFSSDVFSTIRSFAIAPSAWLLPILTTLWGLRLSLYLAWRNHGLPEDKRYAAMRSVRPESFWWQSLFIVFLLQGAVMWVVSLPLQVGIADARAGWTWGHLAGLLLWSVGLFFEAVGDWQLASFRANPLNNGQVLQQGLWRYTRHPNYFGDFCIWWSYYVIAVAHGEHLWTVAGPALMSLFLMRISGVTLLERSLTAEKPAYAEYIQRTNAFFPGLRKK